MSKYVTYSLLAIILLLATVVAIETLGGQPMGLFSGTRPEQLGYQDGHFKPPAKRPNSVSSTVPKEDTHYIAPIAFSGDATAAWVKLVGVVRAQPRVSIVSELSDYLYAEFKSPRMGFVDDVEFALDAKAGVIQVRSASRLGYRDFGVNRQRIEAIRAALNTAAH